MIEQLFNSPFLYSLSLTLVHFLWQGILVALILKSVLSIVDKNKSKLRYGLATVAMLSNATLALFTFIMVYPDSGSGISSNLSPIPLTSLVNELTQQNALLSYQELLPSILAYSLPYLALLWLATITILASKLLIEIRNVNNLPTHSSIAPSSELLVRFNELAKQIHLKKAPRLLISLKAEVPMAIGWLKPVVLLPASMVTGLDSAQLEMLILHELAHIRRHDYLVNFLQTLVELLFFFHPCVHWVGKQMRNEREYCSDDIAVQHCGDAIAYAHTLTDTASLCAKPHFHTIPTMAMAASGGDLKTRVLRLVDHHCAPTNHTSKFLAAVSLLLALSLLSINQVLTMPFAQQLNNKFPWQDAQSLSKTSFQLNQTPATISASVDDRVPNDSIAKYLLSPKSRSEQPLSVVPLNPVLANNDSATQDTVPVVANIQKTTDKVNNIAASSPLKEKINSPTSIDSQSKANTSKKTILASTRPIEPTEQQKASVLNINNNNFAESAAPTKDKRISQSLETAMASIQAQLPNNITKAKVSDVNERFELIESTKPSTMTLTALNIKVEPYRQVSYRQEINDLAMPNELYQTSYKINKAAIQADALQQSNSPANIPQTQPVALEAKLLNSISPVYPTLAKRRGIEMEVKVDFTIDREGKIKDLNFAQQSKLIYFKSAIRSAMRKWRFSPATINNRKVESKMSKIFSFSLQA
jgi:TonB family protein